MNFIDELRFSVKYPFTQLARDIVRNANIDFRNLDPVVLDRAKQRVMQDIRGIPEIKIQTKLSSVLLTELLSYPVAKVLVSLSRNNFVKRRFVSSEVALFRKFLQVEEEYRIYELGRELGINIKDGRMDLKSYLRFIPDDEMYKLYYQQVSGGYVLVDKDSLIEVLASAYRVGLERSVQTYPKDLEFMKRHLDGIVIERKDVEYKGDAKADAFPPCMKAILSDAAAGLHLGHLARFTIATFLANIGVPKERILDVFRGQPNFNEKMTMYHIEYILGERGSGHRKMCPSCDKIKAYGLCLGSDSLCNKVRNPISYYKIKVKRIGS